MFPGSAWVCTRTEYRPHERSGFRGDAHRLVTRHEPPIDVHGFDEVVQAADIQPFHGGTVPDFAFLQALQYVGEGASLQVIVHCSKLLLSQVEP